MSKIEQPEASFNEYRERKAWAEEMAAKHGLELDKGEQHFIIPITDSEGKEIRKEFLPIWENIPVKMKKNGVEISDKVNIEDAIEALKKYPELPFVEGARKIRQEKTTDKEVKQ